MKVKMKKKKKSQRRKNRSYLIDGAMRKIRFLEEAESFLCIEISENCQGEKNKSIAKWTSTRGDHVEQPRRDDPLCCFATHRNAWPRYKRHNLGSGSQS